MIGPLYDQVPTGEYEETENGIRVFSSEPAYAAGVVALNCEFCLLRCRLPETISLDAWNEWTSAHRDEIENDAIALRLIDAAEHGDGIVGYTDRDEMVCPRCSKQMRSALIGRCCNRCGSKNVAIVSTGPTQNT